MDQTAELADAARRRLTAPRIWAGLLVLCLVLASLCFLGAGVIRRTGSASGTVGDALATFGGVLLAATLVAFVGFVFSAARESSDEVHDGQGARSAMIATGIVFVMALVGGGAVVARTVDERHELKPTSTAPTKPAPTTAAGATPPTTAAPAGSDVAPGTAACQPDAPPGAC